jgi:hypothetical protein
VSWPKKVAIASTQDSYQQYGNVTQHGNTKKGFKVQWSWVNKGVAPCYPGGFPTLTLKDEKGGIVSVLVDETINLRDLKVGAAGKAPVRKHVSEFPVGLYAPTTRPGTYDLYVSVGKRDGTPVIALSLKDDDGKRRYKLGQITLRANDTANKAMDSDEE